MEVGDVIFPRLLGRFAIEVSIAFLTSYIILGGDVKHPRLLGKFCNRCIYYISQMICPE